jgi:hypothetical protein
MACMGSYQKAITYASIRLSCGICGILFHEDRALSISLQDDNLGHFLQVTQTPPDSCVITNDRLSICLTCNSCIANKITRPLSTGNFMNRLFY